MNNIAKYLLVAAALFGSTAPACAQDGEPALAPPPPVVAASSRAAGAADSRPAIDLSGGKVYVYDFLDVREDIYKTPVLDEIDRQIAAWLGAKVKGVTILRSTQSPFMLNAKAPENDEWSSRVVAPQSSERIPVQEIIASNRAAAETAFGADYQMVVFPTSFSLQGAWRFYTIRFVVLRKSDGKAWQHYYVGSHMVMLRESERSASRAEKIVKDIDQAMAKDGLVKN